MDKYEYKIRAEEIRELIKQKEYAEAVRIADTIDWRRVKSITMLCTVSDLYKINRRFEESRDLLLLAYDKRPGSRTIIYSLCELCIKMGDIVQAVEYYKEYVQLAQNDTGKYILKYKIYEAQEVSLEERIEVLEEFKKRDYREKWGYELAYLYHRIGLETKCVEECDQLILWFGKGRYVVKAMELKMLHEPLTEEQELKYRELKSGVRPKQRPAEEPLPEDELPIEIKRQDVSNAPTTELPSKELDIQVKPMNVGQYDTINLQKALAESMKEFLSGEEQKQEETLPETESDIDTAEHIPEEIQAEEPETEQAELFPAGGDTIIYTPVGEAVQESVQEPEAESVLEEDLMEENTLAAEEVTEPESAVAAEESEPEEEYVPGAYTQEIIAPLLQDTDEMRPVTPEMLEQVTEVSENEEQPPAEEIFFEDVTSEMPQITEPKAEMPELVIPKVVAAVLATDLKPEIAKMLSQEYDGQISLVVPEQAQVEKQITGQLSIEDVLAEWERMKKENEQKRAEETKKRVLEQTGSLFSEFDESTKNGILEKLQAAAGVLPEASAPEVSEEEPLFTAEEERLQKMLDAVSGVQETVTETEQEIPETTAEADDPETAAAEAEEIEAVTAEPEADEPEAVTAEPEADEPEAVTAEPETDEPEAVTAEPETDEPETKEPETATAEAAEDVQNVVLGETAELPQHIESAMEAAVEAASSESGDQEQSRAENPAGDRVLSEEEKDLYGSFIQTKREKHQIINAVDGMSLAPYTGNIIITGDAGVEKVELAKNLVKELQMSDANFSGKVAKITGKALNKKDIEATLSRIPNGALIIEAAGDLKPDTLKALNKALEKDQNGIMIIMEDTKKAVTRMLEGYSAIADNFTSRIDIEALNNDALVAYAKRYARELEYSIDELGILALYTKIADMQTSEHVVTAAEVRDIIDDAIYSASRKNPRHLMEVLTGRRYDDEDMIVLKERDFML